MVPEKLIDEFVERMRAAAGTNLRGGDSLWVGGGGRLCCRLLGRESAVRARRDFFCSDRGAGSGDRMVGEAEASRCRC